MQEIKLISEVKDIDTVQWNALMEESSVASFFQTKACYDFFNSLSFVEAFVFGVQEDGFLKGVIVGYIQKDGGWLKQFFSRRAIINGGPLLANDISDNALKSLVKGCVSVLRKQTIFIEMRNFNDYSRWKSLFESCDFSYEQHYNFHVDTTSTEVVEHNMGKSRKRDVRISLRDGATIGKASSVEEVNELYAILQDLYRFKVKTPLFPFDFFSKLFESPFAKILVVRYQDRVIGGTVCVELKKRALYEWFACGEDGKYKNISPSTLATYGGIRYAAEQGCTRFDMMGAGKPGDGGYGVRDFKAKFGGQLVEHGRFRFVCNKFLYRIGVVGVKLMRKK